MTQPNQPRQLDLIKQISNTCVSVDTVPQALSVPQCVLNLDVRINGAGETVGGAYSGFNEQKFRVIGCEESGTYHA